MSAISLGIFVFYMILKQLIALVYFISDEQFGGMSIFSFDAIDLLVVLIIYFIIVDLKSLLQIKIILR